MLIVAGEIALEGTALLARAREEQLRTYFHPAFVERAKQMNAGDIPARTAACLGKFADDICVQALAEGGILTALWHLAKETGKGFRVDAAKIPVRQESVEICEFFELNPYGLCSEGAYLIGAERPDAVLCALEDAEIPACIIGWQQKKPDKLLRLDGRDGCLNRPAKDEIYKILSEQEIRQLRKRGEKNASEYCPA